MFSIEVKKFKDMDLKDATIIEGFPRVGLVNTIVATYLISSFNLDQICAVDSEAFPPTSMIYAAKPKFPARIYASSEHKLGVFLAEFTPPPSLHRPIAKKILEWCKQQGCRRIISAENLPSQSKLLIKTNESNAHRVHAIGSTERARKELNEANIEPLNIGMIYGIGGVLLNEGRWEDFDVITLLTEARSEVQDSLTAAKILEELDKLVPNIKIDTKPLYEESKQVEQQLKSLRKQAEKSQVDSEKYMYH